MALIECRDCKRQLSSSAMRCPNCGAQMPGWRWPAGSGRRLLQRTSKALWIMVWIMGGVLAAFFFLIIALLLA